MGRLYFTAIVALALTGCQGRGPLHVPGQDYSIKQSSPPSPITEQSITSFSAAAVPGATNEPGLELTNIVLHAGTSNDWGNIQMRTSTLAPWQSVETNVMGGDRNIPWTGQQAQYRFEKLYERRDYSVTVTKGTNVVLRTNILNSFIGYAGMKPALVWIEPEYQQP